MKAGGIESLFEAGVSILSSIDCLDFAVTCVLVRDLIRNWSALIGAERAFPAVSWKLSSSELRYHRQCSMDQSQSSKWVLREASNARSMVW